MSLIGSTVLGRRRGQADTMPRTSRAVSIAPCPPTPEPDNCPFCAKRLLESAAAHNEILLQNSVVYVLPDIGPLCPGHLLVAARRHVLSMAQLGAAALAGLAFTFSHLCAQLSREFDEYFLFEHGTSPGGAHGPCIDHAHMHLLPMAGSMFDQLTSALPWHSISSFEQLARYQSAEYAYLQIRGSHYVYPNPVIGSQWIRRQVAFALRRDDWDWCLTRSDRELSSTLDGFDRLRPNFGTTSSPPMRPLRRCILRLGQGLYVHE